MTTDTTTRRFLTPQQVALSAARAAYQHWLAAPCGDGAARAHVEETLARLRGEHKEQTMAPTNASADLTDTMAALRAEDDRTTTAPAARARVLRARMGSLAGEPTLDYLYALQREIAGWARQVEDAIDREQHAETLRAERVA